MEPNRIENIILETERLYFRPCRLEDFDLLCRLDTDPDIRAHFPGGILSKDKIKENLERYIRDWETLGYSDFAIFEKGTHEFVGRAGFARYEDAIEIGYVLMKEFWGKGFAREAAQGLIEWAKTHQNVFSVNRIIAFAPVEHIASQKVLEKIGMRFFKTEVYKGHHGMECTGIQCRFYEFRLDD